MDMKDLMGQLMSSQNLKQISKQTNIKEDNMGQAVQVGLMALMEGLNQNSNTEDGAKSLTNALDHHKSGIFEQLNSNHLGRIDMEDGAKITQHIFGGGLPAVTHGLSAETKLNDNQSKDLLSSLAPIVMGMLGQQKAQNNYDSSGVSNLTTSLMGQFLKDTSIKSSILGLVTNMLSPSKEDTGDVLTGILKKLF